MTAENLLEELKSGAWSLAEKPLTGLHEVVRLLVGAPRRAFLEGHRERAIAYLAYTFDRSLLRIPAFIRGGNGDARVKVLVGDVGEALVLTVADSSASRRPGILPFHEETLRGAVEALGLAGSLSAEGGGCSQLSLLDLRGMLRVSLMRRALRYPVAGIVVGVDEDSGKLYAHTLPEPLAASTASLILEGGLDSRVLRALLGFDLQPWESQGGLEPGVRVRVQGDLVAEVIERCDGSCGLNVLPAVLRVLRGGGPRLVARLQRILYNSGLSCEKVLRRPVVLVEQLEKYLDFSIPEELLGVVGSFGVDAENALRGLLEGSSIYMRIGGCKAKLRLRERVEFLAGTTVVRDYLELTVYEGLGGYRRFMLYVSLAGIARKLLASIVLEDLSKPVKFEAVVNGSHVVYGRGFAGALERNTASLRLPVASRRVIEAACRLDRASTRLELLRGVAELASLGFYYGRVGDLYVYTVDGDLSFSHREHGEAMLRLGSPGVVRVTVLNAAPRPPGHVMDMVSQHLGGG
ncbi:MAG: hypothetical protein F7B17_05845 [Desulfurococcales archaeon]|nr:hypothetical protein [Desulfurococcales archaeon]